MWKAFYLRLDKTDVSVPFFQFSLFIDNTDTDPDGSFGCGISDGRFMMPAVETCCVSCQQTAHDVSGDREAAGFKQQMKMVGNKRSSDTSGFCRSGFYQGALKIIPVLVIPKEDTAFYASDNDVVHRSRCVYSG